MKKKHYGEHVIFHSGIGETDGGAVSAHECTGLIPNVPENAYERASYEEIADYSAADAREQVRSL